MTMLAQRFALVRAGTIRRRLTAVLKHTGASTAIETALVLPVLLSFMFGIIEVGHLMWTMSALNLAVQDAARCVSTSNVALNATKNPPCLTQATMQTYAAKRTWGLSIPSNEFQLSTPACGYQVSITHPFKPFVNYIPLSFNISARACFPQWQ